MNLPALPEISGHGNGVQLIGGLHADGVPGVGLLLAGGEYEPILYDGGDTLQRLGTWGEPHTGYVAYFYEHVDRSRTAGHAVRSVIVMDRACHYLGRYAVNPSKPHVVGRVIYFSDASPADGNKIVLTPKGPPQQAWIDGENPELAK